MRMDELEAVCQQAAADIVTREGRPLPPAVVLPLPSATKVMLLPDFPADSSGRGAALHRFVHDVMEPANAPCYGFVAEAEQADGLTLVVAVYGARGHAARITAAPLLNDASGIEGAAQVGQWAESEELHPEALPFVRSLQEAADRADPARTPEDQALPGWPTKPSDRG